MKQILIFTMAVVLPAAAIANACPTTMPASCNSCGSGISMPNAQGNCAGQSTTARIASSCTARNRAAFTTNAFCTCNFAQGVARLDFRN